MDVYQWLLMISTHSQRHILQIREIKAAQRLSPNREGSCCHMPPHCRVLGDRLGRQRQGPRAPCRYPRSVFVPSAREDVRIAAADGTTIAGRFARAGDGRRGVVLFSMCSRNAIDGWATVMERLELGRHQCPRRDFADAPAVESRARRPAAQYTRWRRGCGRRSVGRAPRSGAALAVGGGSCGVHLALLAATRHPQMMRAVVVLSGPYHDALRDAVARSTSLAVFSGASQSEGPAIGWAQALRSSSSASGFAAADSRRHRTRDRDVRG